MAVFQCKMCAANLDVREGDSIVECIYCGTKQTIPTAENEKLQNSVKKEVQNTSSEPKIPPEVEHDQRLEKEIERMLAKDPQDHTIPIHIKQIKDAEKRKQLLSKVKKLKRKKLIRILIAAAIGTAALLLLLLVLLIFL